MEELLNTLSQQGWAPTNLDISLIDGAERRQAGSGLHRDQPTNRPASRYTTID